VLHRAGDDPLFTDLSLEDSAAIIKELDRQAIAYDAQRRDHHHGTEGPRRGCA
jgi:flagellar biosynthesis/type III secretory pathway M-ring protein FliF/YscJ